MGFPPLREITSMRCFCMFISSPLTARITSPVLMPAWSARFPDTTELTTGCTWGSAPMLPISKRPCGTGLTVVATVRPSLSAVSATSRSGRVPVAGFQSRFLGRRPWEYRSDNRRLVEIRLDLRALSQHERQYHDGEQDVHR